MTARWIVAGTGTEVGKTTIAARLAAALRRAGRSVLAVKPIETGFVSLARSDAARIAVAAGHPAIEPAFTAPQPVAPASAAIELGRALELDALVPWLSALERRCHPDFTLVETAGGLFTPLTTTATNLDLGFELAPAGWLLVARDRLGALHDAIATVSACRARGCSPDAIILGVRDADAPPSNARDLEAFLGLPVLEATNLRGLLALLRP